jgi:hemolysin III
MSNDSTPLLKRSINTERMLAATRPRWRGRLHLAMAAWWLPAAVVWTWAAPPGRIRYAAAAFGLGMGLMFLGSALLHLRSWSAHAYERLFRLDRSGIFLAIGGTGAALALLGMEGWPRRVLLAGAVVGTVLGVVSEWLPFAPPRGFSNTVYLTLGWVPVLLLPWLWRASGVLTVALLVLGGLLYTVGAVIVGLRRPDPWPQVFGYHELFHVLVVLAASVHAVMLVRLALVA